MNIVFLNATANQLGVGIFVITGIMGALWLGTQLKKSWFPSEKDRGPIPLPVSVTKTFASKEDLKELEEDMKGRVALLQSQFDQAREANRISLGKIHARIDVLVQNTAELGGELKQVSANMDRLLERHLKE